MIKFYPVELHNHTYHSDGTMSPNELVERALERELKAIAITDHNTTSAANEVINIGKAKGLTVIKGIEWTTFYGHILVYGGNTKVDFRELTFDNIDEKIDKATKEGDIVILAHPTRIGGPVCTGCHLDYKIKNYKNIKGIEAWSRYSPNNEYQNAKAKADWIKLLDSGERIAITYGCDWHNKDYDYPPYGMTFLGAEELSEQALLKALKMGRNYISTGVVADIELKMDNINYEIGDTINQGKADLSIKAGEFSKQYSNNFKVKIKGVKLTGSALENDIYADFIDNYLNFNDLELKKGYLRIEINGTLLDKECTLLLTSPYYVEG